MAYCEFKPVGGTRSVFYNTMTASTHTYQTDYELSSSSIWECRLDGPASSVRRLAFAGGLVLPLIAAATLLAGLWLRSSSPAIGGAPFSVEGMELTPALATSSVSESRAWNAVESEYGNTYLAGARQAALVHVHDLVGDRDAWVFKITGLYIEGPKPLLAKSVPPLTRAFVFVDASSGEVVGVRLDE